MYSSLPPEFSNFQSADLFSKYLYYLFILNNSKMGDCGVKNSFRRLQGHKSRFHGHVVYGYSKNCNEKIPKTNIVTNEFLSVCRQKRATEWFPTYLSEHPKPMEITCIPIHLNHVGQIPNYGGHIPGAIFRFGRTFGKDTIDAKRWLRGDYRPN